MKALFSKGKAVKIAIIDDNSEMLRCLRVMLTRVARNLGVTKPQIIPLMDPHWVLKYYRKHEFPDVILCDYMMPDMDGYEVYEALKSSGYKGEFIFVTAAKDKLEREHAGSFNPDETRIIEKPYSCEDFKDIVSA